MGLKTLHAFLRAHRRIALDTNIFIYHLQSHARYSALTAVLFDWLEQPGHSAVTSTIMMTELLVQPYRDGGESRVDDFFGALSTYPNLDWIAPDLEIADTAARIRAHHRLRTPDAILAATTIHEAVTGLVTNDEVFQRVSGFETMLLDELL